MRSHVLRALPYPVQVVVGLLAYRKVTATLHGHGTGRFTDDELASFRQQVWSSINAPLGASKRRTTTTTNPPSHEDEVPFWIMGGDSPTEADAVVFGFVASTLICTA